jgi:hypothetical protein
MYEYGTLKPVEVILTRGRGRWRMEGMNQTKHCTYIWICHNKTFVKLLCTNKNYYALIKIFKKKKKSKRTGSMVQMVDHFPARLEVLNLILATSKKSASKRDFFHIGHTISFLNDY